LSATSSYESKTRLCYRIEREQRVYAVAKLS